MSGHQYGIGRARGGGMNELRCRHCRHSFEKCRSKRIGCEHRLPAKEYVSLAPGAHPSNGWFVERKVC
jgi:hypothetical protein